VRPLALWILALLVHGAWALTVPAPVDWDPAYYSAVARHLVAGEGAVTGSVVFLAHLPEALPATADLHWAPLPSRVLVPGVLLWEHGDRLVNACILATWAPLAWALTRALGRPRLALWAGVLAASGLGYARMGASPDSIALAGALGGLALLALLHERPRVLGLALAGLVLTRGDALFVVLGFAVFARRQSLAAMGVPLLVAAAWWWRGHGLEVDRTALLQAGDYGAWLLGEPSRRSVFGGLAGLPTAYGLAFGLTLPLALSGHSPKLRPLWTAGVLLAGGTCLIAPALAESGTLYRSGAILVPGLCAAAVIGIDRLARWRDLHPAFAFGVLGGGVLLTSVGLGARNASLKPSVEVICPAISPDEIVFSDEPLLLELECGATAVRLPPGLSAEKEAELRKRYAIRRVFRVHGS